MSQFDFSYSNNQKKDYSKNYNNVGYFSLKNDGEEAIVRLSYKDISELDGKYVHTITVDGKYRLVECLRNAYEPVDSCPLCAKGEKLTSKMFVKMLHYTKDENGNVVANPVVWTTSTTFGKKIVNFINEYGDLSEYVFKLKRYGAAGSRDTSYELMPVNMAIYKPEIYVKDFSAFNDLKLSGRFYLEKSKEDLNTYIETGSLPMPVKQQAQQTETSYASQQQYKEAQTYQSTSTTSYQPEVVSRPMPSVDTSIDNDPTMQRPRRYTFN